MPFLRFEFGISMSGFMSFKISDKSCSVNFSFCTNLDFMPFIIPEYGVLTSVRGSSPSAVMP